MSDDVTDDLYFLSGWFKDLREHLGTKEEMELGILRKLSQLENQTNNLIKQYNRLESESLALVRQSAIDTRCLGEIMDRIRKLECRDSEPQQPPQPTPAKGMTALEAIIWCAQHPGQKAWDACGDWVSFSKTGVLENVTFHSKYEPYYTTENPAK